MINNLEALAKIFIKKILHLSVGKRLWFSLNMWVLEQMPHIHGVN